MRRTRPGEPTSRSVRVTTPASAESGAAGASAPSAPHDRRVVLRRPHGSASVTDEQGLDIGPHPHCGLQMVTWLIQGGALHRDSLGSEQVIKAGQLNLMNAGFGVSHAEEATGHFRGTLQGVQLWIALPEATRHLAASFEHFADLAKVELAGGSGTVLAGEFLGHSSPARHDTPLVGVDLKLRSATEVALQPGFEHAFIVLEGALEVRGDRIAAGQLGYLAPGPDEVRLDVEEHARVILLGGEPLKEELLLWWNFVARSREEIDAAYEAWVTPDGRFGGMASALARMDTPPPCWPLADGPAVLALGVVAARSTRRRNDLPRVTPTDGLHRTSPRSSTQGSGSGDERHHDESDDGGDVAQQRARHRG